MKKLIELDSMRITQLLEDRQWTRYHLSQRSGVSCSTISMIIDCKNKSVKDSTILNLCRGFDISLLDFYNHEMFKPENISDD